MSLAVATPPQGASEWVVIATAGEGFSVTLPVKPEEQTDRIPMMGNTYKTRMYTSVDPGTGMLYIVVMQEFAPIAEGLSAVARLDKFMQGFTEGLNNSLGSASGSKLDLKLDRDLDLKGHLGRQYALSYGERPGLVRAFDSGSRVYLLLILGADEKNSSVARVLDSFAITPAPAPVPQPITETKP